MFSLQLKGGMTHGQSNMAIETTHEGKEAGKMEQLPQWLTAAVNAAGMTAYAEGLEPKTLKDTPKSKRPALDDDTPILPLH
jgi:hypothetical protein